MGSEKMVRKIGLAGKSGSGKDVVADYLGDRYSYKKIAVADAIRNEVADFFDHALGSWFTHIPGFVTVIKAFKGMVWEKPTHSAMRVLLQWWGTEYRRSQDPDYWTKKLAARLDNNEWIVVSDVRTPEEMRVIREAGGEVWFVSRPGVAPVGIPNHYTEVALEGATFDQTILNDGTLEDLFQLVDWKADSFCNCKS
jgi:hypothetical protein